MYNSLSRGDKRSVTQVVYTSEVLFNFSFPLILSFHIGAMILEVRDGEVTNQKEKFFFGETFFFLNLSMACALVELDPNLPLSLFVIATNPLSLPVALALAAAFSSFMF